MLVDKIMSKSILRIQCYTYQSFEEVLHQELQSWCNIEEPNLNRNKRIRRELRIKQKCYDMNIRKNRLEDLLYELVFT